MKGTNPDLTFEVVTDFSKIMELKNAWKELLDQSVCNRVFSHPVWYIHCCQSFQLSPYVVVAKQNNKVKGVFPLVVQPKGFRFVDRMLSDYQDLIVGRGDDKTAMALLEYVIEKKKDGDDLILINLLKDSNIIQSISEQKETEHDFKIEVESSCPILNLSGGWEAYFKSRTSHFRQRMNVMARKLEAAGIKLEQLLPTDPQIDTIADKFISIHLERHSDPNEVSVFTVPQSQEVIRNTFPILGKEGVLLFNCLKEGEKVVGILIETLGFQSLGAWQSGFLSQYSHFSPLRYLFLKAVQNAANKKIIEYDLMRGMEEYKLQWSTGHKNTYKLTIK